MKIEVNDKNTIRFRDINVKDIFYIYKNYSDENNVKVFFMKVDKITSINCNDLNAVNLSTGQICFFASLDEVHLVNDAKLVINLK